VKHARLLPLPEKRGLSRVQAAEYVGVSPSTFDELVASGRMPRPRTVKSRIIWDRWELDEAFETLPHKDGPSPDRSEAWSDVAV
jgi:excisionase family DNA binding protein